jgi:hypothetical protein
MRSKTTEFDLLCAELDNIRRIRERDACTSGRVALKSLVAGGRLSAIEASKAELLLNRLEARSW